MVGSANVDADGVGIEPAFDLADALTNGRDGDESLEFIRNIGKHVASLDIHDSVAAANFNEVELIRQDQAGYVTLRKAVIHPKQFVDQFFDHVRFSGKGP